jgi:hypothetical protein
MRYVLHSVLGRPTSLFNFPPIICPEAVKRPTGCYSGMSHARYGKFLTRTQSTCSSFQRCASFYRIICEIRLYSCSHLLHPDRERPWTGPAIDLTQRSCDSLNFTQNPFLLYSIAIMVYKRFYSNDTFIQLSNSSSLLGWLEHVIIMGQIRVATIIFENKPRG